MIIWTVTAIANSDPIDIETIGAMRTEAAALTLAQRIISWVTEEYPHLAFKVRSPPHTRHVSWFDLIERDHPDRTFRPAFITVKPLSLDNAITGRDRRKLGMSPLLRQAGEDVEWGLADTVTEAVKRIRESEANGLGDGELEDLIDNLTPFRPKTKRGRIRRGWLHRQLKELDATLARSIASESS